MRLLLLVVAWHYELVYLLAERSPQERDDLRAGAVIAVQRLSRSRPWSRRSCSTTPPIHTPIRAHR